MTELRYKINDSFGTFAAFTFLTDVKVYLKANIFYPEGELVVWDSQEGKRINIEELKKDKK